MRQVSFNERNFFERVSCAAREPVYSAALRWLLDERSPLSRAHRLAIVHALSKEDTSDGLKIIAVTEKKMTEKKKIDLMLTVERATGFHLHVAVENKIKSVQGRAQLATYDKHLDGLSGTVRKVFLTLTEEPPSSGSGWTPASYAGLLDAIRAQPVSGNQYVLDLCDAIERLIAVAEAAQAESGVVAAAAFRDDEVDDVTSYVKDMRLGKVVQRIWMSDLAKRLDVNAPWRTTIGETNGQALLDVEALFQDPPGYRVGMQLQRHTLKAFCEPYQKVANENAVETILERIRCALVLGPNARASKGKFRSFSIETDLPRARKRDEWVAVVQPWLARLDDVFPSVQSLDAMPLVGDDE